MGQPLASGVENGRAADVPSHAPITERHVGGALSVAELCWATMIYSDNPAANLLLPLVGDPAGLTAFLRRIGDTQTRSDRREPEINRFAEGDPCDTTTPAACPRCCSAMHCDQLPASNWPSG